MDQDRDPTPMDHQPEVPPAEGRDDLRQEVATALLETTDLIVNDTVAVFPRDEDGALDDAACQRLGQLMVRLLSSAVRDGRADARGGYLADVHQLALERSLPIGRLFLLAYLVERTALDELALNQHLGATAEAWPLAAQLVRRASFDLLAAYAERVTFDPNRATIVDPLTTLYTWPVLEAVLDKEVERAGRLGTAISFILFDVDGLSAINREHGHGVGDRILERIGILIRQYFRHQDWVARGLDDAFAVLLVGGTTHAADLAESVRASVEERLGFTDHRTDQPVRVTVSGAVVNIQTAVGDVLDPERLQADADTALARAKRAGGNRIERVDGYSGTPGTPQREEV